MGLFGLIKNNQSLAHDFLVLRHGARLPQHFSTQGGHF
jgi:hypothetical protein